MQGKAGKFDNLKYTCM